MELVNLRAKIGQRLETTIEEIQPEKGDLNWEQVKNCNQ